MAVVVVFLVIGIVLGVIAVSLARLPVDTGAQVVVQDVLARQRLHQVRAELNALQRQAREELVAEMRAYEQR